MKNKDCTHLRLMLDFAYRVQRRLANVSLDSFLGDEDLQDMVLYAMGQVGENANAISDETRDRHPNILWGPIIGIRNRIFHSYGDVEMSLVYEAAVDHIPVLIRQLQAIPGINQP